MRKYILPILVLVLSLFLLPTKVFAAVDLSATDTTSSDGTKAITLSVNTGTDSLSKISFDVQTSDNVTISKATAVQNTCDSFSYVNDNHILKVTCQFSTPTKLSGSIGTVTFTTTSNNYTFTILNNSDLNLDGLTLGNIVNVTAVDSSDTNTTATTQTTATTTSTTKTLKEQISDYLPYVLIGGAVILLISILGIVLGKKKTYPIVPVSSATTPKTVVPDNQEKVEPVLPIKEEIVSSPTFNLPEKPTIGQMINDEKPENTEVTNNSTPTPVKVAEDRQSQDLQDILKMEAAASPMAPIPETPTVEDVTPVIRTQTVVNPVPEIQVTPVQPQIDKEVEIPESMVEEPIPTQNEDQTNHVDLTQFINPVKEAPIKQYFSPSAPEINTTVPAKEELSDFSLEKPVIEIKTQEEQPIQDLQSLIDTQVQQVSSVTPSNTPDVSTPEVQASNTGNNMPL
jgi:hypothetical protein